MKIYSCNSTIPNRNLIQTYANYSNLRSDGHNADKISFCGAAAVMNVTPAVVWNKEFAQKFIDVFKTVSQNAPKGLILKVSKDDNSILEGFKKKLENNVVLEVCKNTYKRLRGDITYVTVKEFRDGKLSDAFGIDYDNDDLLGLNRNCDLALLHNDCIRVTTRNPKYATYCAMLAKYSDLVFNHQDTEEKSIIEEDPIPVVKEAEIEEEEEEEIIERPISPRHIRRLGKIPTDCKVDYLLRPAVCAKVAGINNKIMEHSCFLSARRGYSADIVKLKMEYNPIIYADKKQKNMTFKYGDGETLSVLHIPSNERFTRIIHKDKEGNETHYLIEEQQKIISNLNKKNPWLMPEKLRYMTTAEIEASDIESYIEFLNEAIEKYNTYLKEALKQLLVKRKEKIIDSEAEISTLDQKIDEMLAGRLDKFTGDINQLQTKYVTKQATPNLIDAISKYSEFIQKEFQELQLKSKLYLENLVKEAQNKQQ